MNEVLGGEAQHEGLNIDESQGVVSAVDASPSHVYINKSLKSSQLPYFHQLYTTRNVTATEKFHLFPSLRTNLISLLYEHSAAQTIQESFSTASSFARDFKEQISSSGLFKKLSTRKKSLSKLQGHQPYQKAIDNQLVSPSFNNSCNTRSVLGLPSVIVFERSESPDSSVQCEPLVVRKKRKTCQKTFDGSISTPCGVIQPQRSFSTPANNSFFSHPKGATVYQNYFSKAPAFRIYSGTATKRKFEILQRQQSSGLRHSISQSISRPQYRDSPLSLHIDVSNPNLILPAQPPWTTISTSIVGAVNPRISRIPLFVPSQIFMMSQAADIENLHSTPANSKRGRSGTVNTSRFMPVPENDQSRSANSNTYRESLENDLTALSGRARPDSDVLGQWSNGFRPVDQKNQVYRGPNQQEALTPEKPSTPPNDPVTHAAMMKRLASAQHVHGKTPAIDPSVYTPTAPSLRRSTHDGTSKRQGDTQLSFDTLLNNQRAEPNRRRSNAIMGPKTAVVKSSVDLFGDSVKQTPFPDLDSDQYNIFDHPGDSAYSRPVVGRMADLPPDKKAIALEQARRASDAANRKMRGASASMIANYGSDPADSQMSPDTTRPALTKKNSRPDGVATPLSRYRTYPMQYSSPSYTQSLATQQDTVSPSSHPVAKNQRKTSFQTVQIREPDSVTTQTDGQAVCGSGPFLRLSLYIRRRFTSIKQKFVRRTNQTQDGH